MRQTCIVKNGEEWVDGILLGFVRGEIQRVDNYHNLVTWPVTFAVICVRDKLIEVTLDQVKMT